MNEFEFHIDDFIEQSNSKVLYVAVSGGIDSVCLLHAIKSHSRIPVKALHVNYHLRGSESNQDELFVREFCSQLGIEIEVLDVDFNIQFEGNNNVQNEARKVRYALFQQKIDDENALIALGHHQDDQIETFWINLTRNSGMMGLSGMLAYNKGICRPFLSWERNDIIDYAKRHNLKWREDSSNITMKYTRNILRHAFIPQIELTQPGISEDVLLLMRVFQENQLELSNKLDEILLGVSKSTIQEKIWNELSQIERLELLRHYQIPLGQYVEVDKLFKAQKGGKIDLSNGMRLVREREFILLHDKIRTEHSSELILRLVDSLPDTFNKNTIYLNPALLNGELKCRKWKRGDRIHPVGMNGIQLVSDSIRLAQVPHHQRENILVVHDDVSIHWVVGIKVGGLALAKESDSHILEVSIDLLQ